MDGPQDWISTGSLIAATAAGAAACAGSVARVVRGRASGQRVERIATVAMGVLAGAVFAYRMTRHGEGWAPLRSHADGLALLVAMLAATAVYLQWTRRLAGLAMFLLPAATVASLWGVCATWWSWHPFSVAGVWNSVHLVSVYVGTLGAATAAGAGALWLYVDRQLRKRDHPGDRLGRLGRLASLESIERAMIASAVAGFALLTLALLSGLVIVTGDAATKLGPGWWYSPKVVLAAATWAVFALVMNVRFVSAFRGRRAAMLSIIGFVMFIGVMGLSQALGDPGDTSAPSRLPLDGHVESRGGS